MRRPPGIVQGQKVSPAKLERARKFRRVMTPEEKLLWDRLRAGRLKGLHFRRQQVIDGLIADFYCHEVGLIVEVDGDVHLRQVDHDAERDRILAAHALRIVRFTNEEVRTQLAVVLERIFKACSSDEGTGAI